MATDLGRNMQIMLTICGYGVCLFMGMLCFILLRKIWRNEIDLSTLLQEANGRASMSRFQLLIFTLVVAVSLFTLVERTTPPGFPTIPDGVLWLLGISGSTYAVGKGISYSRLEGVTSPEERAAVRENAAEIAAAGSAVDAKASETLAAGAPPRD
jgi:hypothetical protein